ncbi:hypothetical protein PAXRUDRAFT_779201 [Paxillus rubicundulus Ve08.2h10]|uniref:Helicase ATP-binding domain-containing protein n=1 Tax=Paxillus rubicundulus Ve08.2h10 TaxID=930991 RepID=A0A0D0CP44_9AGAM|nr:hypothetical protein PAXRUDRAFT_779201 [Paxillus rubicundulus Ve08.2h10]
MSGRSPVVPPIANMQSVVQDKFGLRPCACQLQSAQYQLESKDVFTVSPTGSGNTLTFWIPLLFNNNGIIIIITPLNILGEKICDEAIQHGFPAINLCAETATDQAYKCILTDSHFQVLWKLKKFGDKLFNITFDEGHCISEWGDDFRPLYGQLGNLRWFLPNHTAFHVISATMPPHIISDVKTKLHMRPYNLAKIIRSNDHPNINLIVEEMKFPRNSMYDLTHVMDLWGGSQPEKFMLFTNSCGSAESACKHLHTDLSPHFQDKIIWFHSVMTMQFCIEAIEKL